MTGSHADDAELIVAAQGGDQAAWGSLVRRHAPGVAAYLGARLRRPEIVDRLLGEAIVAGWRQRAECDDPAAFQGWLRKIAGAVAMRWAREHPDEPVEGPFPLDRVPARGLDSAGRLAELDQAIGRLPEQQRMALELRWRGGLTDESLAAALRLSVSDAVRLAEQAEEALAGGARG
jgi:RNA polymerase sigma-70 factor (ECF subfamily)